jgi:hypothetical protein
MTQTIPCSRAIPREAAGTFNVGQHVFLTSRWWVAVSF